MAGLPDPHAGAYDALVSALAEEGLPRRTEAVRAVEAVACALARRLAGVEHEEVRERLPAPFRGRLTTCERHAATDAPVDWGGAGFVGAVAEELERDRDAAEAQVRAVLGALRRQLGEEDGEDVQRLLPPDLEPLWRRPS